MFALEHSQLIFVWCIQSVQFFRPISSSFKRYFDMSL